MKIPKILFAIAPLMLGGCQALKDAQDKALAVVNNPPEAVVTAGHLLFDFIGGVLKVGLSTVIHSILPF